ncbi:helix-turn-helix transcriptional regulator [Nocardia araoensis]|uniref:helix-turn-helix transcriptional regulator n=1 Tax=Nocardia araoensis TaxID=228600 RepID=UPI0002FC6C44|nr:helix-turn-helix transcriptional regulator [Nocardia araoensis]
MWQGTATLYPGRLLYAGRLGSAHRHHHAAAQLIFSTDGSVGLRDDAGRDWSGRAALIPPGVSHETTGTATGLLVFADAQSPLGRALTDCVRRTGSAVDSVTAWSRAALPLLDLDDGERDPQQLAHAALTALIGDPAPTGAARHPALRRALELLPDLLDGPLRLAELAAAVGLSASRLGHLFRAELGLAFPPYLRWARLRQAMDHVRRGGTLTEAAHAAGFADSAHLTRVCREMFGLTPSELAGAVTMVRP